MEITLAILVGALYTAGVYMILRRSVLKFVIGIILISNATNILVFLASGPLEAKPVFVEEGIMNAENFADPIPQALLLTAVVIGLGIVGFTLALKLKFFETSGSDDMDEIKPTEQKT
jgi:multicomponent Na+:H+ antiporter subunit C